MFKHIAAIVFIFVCCGVAWGVLGATVLKRTYSSNASIEQQVGQLWGTAQVQRSPNFYYETQREEKIDNKVTLVTIKHPIPLEASKINVDLKLEQRRKGLLWYPTYTVSFAGDYKFQNATDKVQTIFAEFPLPAEQAVYDNFKFVLGDKVMNHVQPSSNAVVFSLPVEPGKVSNLSVAYDSRGMESWRYAFGTYGSAVSHVKDFSLSMTTNFRNIDFPQGSMSPALKTEKGDGWNLSWNYKNMLTGYDVGMSMPQKLNPGPWVSEVTFFAPVSLFLFFFCLFVFTMVKGIRIHPMNYFFIGGGFFSFHLLLAYLVDHVAVEAAFWICAAVSILLVSTYMRLVVSGRFAFIEVTIAQFVYLVLFSYSFFFEQYTGLAVTVLSIVTLFVLMQFTGKVDWDEVFAKRASKKSTAVIPSAPAS